MQHIIIMEEVVQAVSIWFISFLVFENTLLLSSNNNIDFFDLFVKPYFTLFDTNLSRDFNK